MTRNRRDARYLATAILCTLAVAPALGSMVEIPVTPTSLDTYFFLFSVSTQSATNGTAFHIVMTAKTEDIETNDSGAGLQLVRHAQHGTGLEGSIEDLKAAAPVTLEMEKRVWTADFVIPAKWLEDPNVYFDFSFLAHTMLNGKRIAMPSATFYEIRLQDFTGQIYHSLAGRWQAESGDTFELTDTGRYQHWRQQPAISKSAEADAMGPSDRTGLESGTFSINGNFFVLTQDTGVKSTNQFYITTDKPEAVPGKFFGTGWSFIILSNTGSRETISKYELMYR